MKQLIFPTMLIGLILILLNQFFIWSLLNYSYGEFYRLEDLFASSSSIIIFIVCFLFMLCLWVYSFYSNYIGSKSIYTLFTLPIPRYTIYWSKFIAYALSLGLLVSIQILSFFISASWYTSWLSNASYQLHHIMPNGLALAFVRSPYLRFIIPLSISSFISNLTLMIICISSTIHLFLLERHKHYITLIITLAITVGGIFYIVFNRLDYLTYDSFNLLQSSSILFIFSIYFIYRSLKLMKHMDIS